MENQLNSNLLPEDEFGGMFSMSAADVTASVSNDEVVGDPDYYSTSLKNKNVKDGVYKGLGRFIPNIFGSKQSVIRKWIYYFNTQSPDGKESAFYVDCPSNGGVRNNIISSAYFELKDHGSTTLRQMARANFQRKEYYWSLYQIMSDKQQPDLEGKIKIYRYGKQVFEKIDNAGKDDPEKFKKGVNVFDPFVGKDFLLDIREKTMENKFTGKQETQTSYELSEFSGTQASMVLNFPFNPELVRPTSSKERMMEIYEYVKGNCPLLDKIAYTPWDEKMEEKVIIAVRGLINDDAIFNKIYAETTKKGGFINKSTKVYTSEPLNTTTQTQTTEPAVQNNQSAQYAQEIQQNNEKPVVSTTITSSSQEVKTEPQPEVKIEVKTEVNQSAVVTDVKETNIQEEAARLTASLNKEQVVEKKPEEANGDGNIDFTNIDFSKI